MEVPLTTIASISPSESGFQVPSTAPAPLVETLAMLSRVNPPIVENRPPTKMLPRPSSASVRTAHALHDELPQSAFGFQLASAAPVDGESFAIRRRVCPPIDVNRPPA